MRTDGSAAGTARNSPAAASSRDFDEALDASDVVIMLRLQKERMQSRPGLGEAEYFAATASPQRACATRATMRS